MVGSSSGGDGGGGIIILCIYTHINKKGNIVGFSVFHLVDWLFICLFSSSNNDEDLLSFSSYYSYYLLKSLSLFLMLLSGRFRCNGRCRGGRCSTGHTRRRVYRRG